jgi:glucose/mannose-6-phosphate isomerase
MLDLVREQPDHLLDALWRVDAAGLRAVDAPGGLVVCGMGGSAIGGDLAAAAIGDRAVRPLRTVREYAPPPWLSAGALVLCASYSGDTHETLACFEAAGAAGAARVALTTGGELAEAARAEGVPVIGAPGGLQPRAAVAYMVVGALECAALAGAAPSLRAEVEAASALQRELLESWGALAGEIAAELSGTVPLVYGSGPTDPVALRWKTQLNENAKVPAFSSVLPEADHNEICGYERSSGFAAVFLEDRGQDARNRQRIELTAAAAAESGMAVRRVESRGETGLERVMSLVLLGDLVSVLLAELEGTDPVGTEALDRLKEELR